MSPATVRIRLLGPFEVRVADRPVAIPDRLRSLLAALALSSGRVVSVEVLARAIWGEELPNRVKGSIQTAMTRLRQVVGQDVVAAARKHATAAVDLTTGDVTNRCAGCAWWARGEVLLRAGDHADAADAFRRALIEDNALVAAAWLGARDELCLPAPMAGRRSAAHTRWAEAAGPVWTSLLAAAETRTAEENIAVVTGFVGGRR